MQKYLKQTLICILSLLLSLSLAFPLNAQKFKRNKRKRNLSDKELVQAESYFIEGQKHFMLEDYSKAYGYFRKALNINEESAAIHFKMAETLQKQGENEKALNYAMKAVSLSPDNKYYYLLTAELYTNMSAFKEAAAVYEEMLKNIDGTEQYLFELASVYLYMEDYPKALQTYDRAQETFGINEQLSFQKQKIYLSLNQVEKALEEGQALIDAYPGEENYVLRQAEILKNNEQLQKAREILNQLLEHKNSARAHLLLAELYNSEQKHQLAQEHLSEAFQNSELEVAPKLQMLNTYMVRLPDAEAEKISLKLAEAIEKAHPYEFQALAVYGDLLMKLDRKQQALNKYLKALKLDQSNYNIWQNIISIEMDLQQYEQVIKHSDDALILFPNQPALYYFNGTANMVRNNYNEAVLALEQGKKLSTKNADLQSYFNSQLGDAYNSLKQYDKSDKAYEQALEINQDNYHVLNNYSYFLSLRGEKLKLAQKMSQKLVKDHPKNATYLDTHAWVLYTMGKYKEARKYMEKALEVTQSSTLIEHYGDILYRLGDTEKAVKQWQKAKQLNNNSSELLDKKIADRKLYE